MQNIDEPNEPSKVEIPSPPESYQLVACPLCKREEALRYEARYPLAVCPVCVGQITDNSGRRLVFYEDALLGFTGYYPDSQGKEYYKSRFCYVKGVRCWAEVMRFGGIVIQIYQEKT
ncbi:hypothetical protein [Hugenholtzia roseola]|uniref:hypothetical protein n=1 Tax=Hugenholtzia roseola TaxID=1002 RepID=UPI00042184D7|nr:hypothetical protein [Hugenholtzia roseola]